MRAFDEPATVFPQRRGHGLEYDEEEDMPNTTTPRIADLLRVIRRWAAAAHGVRPARVVAGSLAALRRLDDWTLVAFNPRYPSPLRGR